MIIFSKSKTSDDLLVVRVFEVRVQLNLAFRLCYSPTIPFTFELGLGLITISYEINNFRKR